MQLPVMATAERDGELVADFHAERSRLRKAQVMWIGWLPSAHQARLGGDELQMRLVAQPLGFGQGEPALVDQGW
jgi:hypothetical protein